MLIKISFGKRENQNPYRSIAGGLICIALAALGFDTAFFAGDIAGGIPFLPADLNQAIGRLMFGFGALFTTLIGIYAFWEAYDIFRERREL